MEPENKRRKINPPQRRRIALRDVRGGARKLTYKLGLVRGISKTSAEVFKYLKMKANIHNFRVSSNNDQEDIKWASPHPTMKDTFPKATEKSMAAGAHINIQRAKNFAVAQAQQEGCTANFRIFDSPFGNFLIPAIPTRAELSG